MFIAVYEFTVKAGREAAFRKAWLELTKGIYETYGSLGSRLHRDSRSEGLWVGYAQWPDRDAWQVEKPELPGRFQAARKQMLECLIDSKTVYELEVVEDYLQSESLKH